MREGRRGIKRECEGAERGKGEGCEGEENELDVPRQGTEGGGILS